MKIRIRTELPDGTPFTVHATATDHWTYGATEYHVRAPRVSGAFTVRPTWNPWTACDDIDTPHVHVMYGRTSDGRPDTFGRERDAAPIVNGVQLHGGAVINTETLREQRLTRRDVSVRRPTGPYTATSAPDATADRTATVVGALLTHWLTRGPVTLAHRITAARIHGAEQCTAYAEDRRRANERITEARQALDDLAQREAAAARVMAAPPATT